MIAKTENDWNPGTYNRFRGLRLRPALDLMAQVDALPDGDVIDLGVGAGAMGPPLRARFAGRRLIGVDTSPAMLAAADATGSFDALIEADAAQWMPSSPPALIFSNALFHWIDHHDAVFARLADALAPGGTLAVQMPRQFDAPSHVLLRDLAESEFPDRFDFSAWIAPVARPEDYVRILAPLGQVSAWETVYVHRLEPSRTAHPVRRFTEASAMRPFLAKLTSDEAAAFTATYEAALAAAYPVEEDGTVLFPFRRVFFTLRVG